MNFQDALMTANLVLASDAVPLIVGQTGIGKTALAKRLATDLEAHLIVIDANILKEGEIGGLPTTEDYEVIIEGTLIKRRRTVYAIHTKLLEIDEVLIKDSHKKVLLFIDELNRCEHAVQQELMNLILNREINSYKLHSNVFLLAAMNPSNKYDNFTDTDYQVVDMDPAQEDRFVWIQMDSDANSWLAWGREEYQNNKGQWVSNIHPHILEFIATFPDYLHTPTSQDTIKATPRSWQRVSDAYKIFLDKNYNFSDKIFYNVLKGNIGSSIAQDFFNFLESHKNPLIKPEEVFGQVLDDDIIDRIQSDNHSRLFLTAKNCLYFLLNKQQENTEKEKNIRQFVNFIDFYPNDLKMAIMIDIKEHYHDSLYQDFLKVDKFVQSYFEIYQSID